MMGGARETTTHGEAFAPVPLIIHQTWKTSEIPHHWQPHQQSWQRQHPQWEYRLWTDADNRRLIEERYSWFLDTYDRFPRHIQRVDAAKYFILYTHGGVYADLDCECVKPLDPLIATGGAIVSHTRDNVIDCALMASPPGHRLWLEVFEQLRRPTWATRLIRHIPGLQASHVLFSTGTRMMKRAVERYIGTGGTVPADGITVCEASLFSSRSWLDRYRPFETADTFVRHHYDDSWLSPGERRVHVWMTRRTGLAMLIAIVATALLLLR